MKTISTGKIHSLESFGTVDGPGIRFVVFFQGCPLRCQYCHNPDTWEISSKPKYLYEPDALLKEVLRYKSFLSKGGVTATGGEPLLQPDFVRDFFTLCRKEGLHTALDTSGYLLSDKIKEVLDVTDLVLLDIKATDPDLHKTLTGVAKDNPVKFLNYLEETGKPTWIRHVIVPGLTDNDEQLEALAQFLQPYKVIEKIELLPYHRMGIHKYEQLGIPYPLAGLDPLSKERLDHAREIFKRYSFTIQ